MKSGDPLNQDSQNKEGKVWKQLEKTEWGLFALKES